MSEHDNMGALLEHLSKAKEAAFALSFDRPDQPWNKVAELLASVYENIQRLGLASAARKQ